jgi:cytochrome c
LKQLKKLIKMKKSLLLVLFAALLVVSCGESKKKEVKEEVVPVTVEETDVVAVDADGDAEEVDVVTVSVDNIELGKKLFTEKTCATCHQADAKVIGPSIKDINKIYAEKNGDMIKFLKGNAEAIVDTDPGQVAIMKANLDGFVKDLSDEDLAAITSYMGSVK